MFANLLLLMNTYRHVVEPNLPGDYPLRITMHFESSKQDIIDYAKQASEPSLFYSTFWGIFDMRVNGTNVTLNSKDDHATNDLAWLIDSHKDIVTPKSSLPLKTLEDWIENAEDKHYGHQLGSIMHRYPSEGMKQIAYVCTSPGELSIYFRGDDGSVETEQVSCDDFTRSLKDHSLHILNKLAELSTSLKNSKDVQTYLAKAREM